MVFCWEGGVNVDSFRYRIINNNQVTFLGGILIINFFFPPSKKYCTSLALVIKSMALGISPGLGPGIKAFLFLSPLVSLVVQGLLTFSSPSVMVDKIVVGNSVFLPSFY